MKNDPQNRQPLQSRDSKWSQGTPSHILELPKEGGIGNNPEHLWEAHTLGRAPAALEMVSQKPTYPGLPHPGNQRRRRKRTRRAPCPSEAETPGSCVKAREPRCVREAQKRMRLELSPNWHPEKPPQNLSREGRVVQNSRINVHRAPGHRMNEKEREAPTARPLWPLQTSVLELWVRCRPSTVSLSPGWGKNHQLEICREWKTGKRGMEDLEKGPRELLEKKDTVTGESAARTFWNPWLDLKVAWEFGLVSTAHREGLKGTLPKFSGTNYHPFGGMSRDDP